MFEAEIDTPLGPMLAAGDEEFLYRLEFIDPRKGGVSARSGKSGPIEQIKRELSDYFSGGNGEFKTPLALIGSPFQKQVWEELRKIPFGTTKSYAEIAGLIGKAGAFRAVGSANGSNRFAIVIPCHRVINQNGALGGYAGGIEKKEWLLKHERCQKPVFRI